MDQSTRERCMKLAGLKHMLRPNPRDVATDEKWNGYLDSITAGINTLRAESAETDTPVDEIKGEPEKAPPRKRKGKTPNRQHTGGMDRSGE